MPEASTKTAYNTAAKGMVMSSAQRLEPMRWVKAACPQWAAMPMSTAQARGFQK